ncbi:MAG: tetratricopeptide repeat protein [Candidatus Hodarchaeales archaeon]|jgi:predicted amidohydrolase
MGHYNTNNKSQSADSINHQIHNINKSLKVKKFEEALMNVDEILNNRSFQLTLSQKFDVRLKRILIFMHLKQHEKITYESKICEQILNEMDRVERDDPLLKEGEARLLSIQGAIHTNQGDLVKSINSYQKSFELYKTLNNKQGMFHQVHEIGWIRRTQGELDEALDNFHICLKLAKEFGRKKVIAWTLNSISLIYFYKGELDLAEEHAKKSMEFFEEKNHTEVLSWSFSLLGSIYRGKGDLSISREYYQKALNIISENTLNQNQIVHSYCYAQRNIGKIYYEKNMINQSIKQYKEAENAHNSFCTMKNTLFDYEIIVDNIFLIQSGLEIADYDLIDHSIEVLSEYARKWPWADLFWKYGRALLLKSKLRAKFKFQAQQLFEELLEKKFDYELEFSIQVLLCELYLEELKYSGEEAVLEDIQGLLQKISIVANKQRSVTTLLTLYSLQAKLALVEGNAELSDNLITKALSIAEKRGLELVASKLKNQQKEVLHQLEEWKELLVRNSSLQQKIEFLNLKEFITEAKKVILEKKYEPKRKYELAYLDILKNQSKSQKSNFIVGIAQIGISTTGDFLAEFYKEYEKGLLGIQEEKIESVRFKIENLIRKASAKNVNILAFPELAIDLNYKQVLQDLSSFAKKYDMYIIPGSYHNRKSKRNLSVLITPDGIIMEQEKHIPATIHFKGEKFEEGIDTGSIPHRTIICNTEYGRIAIVICRDFLDMDLRVELKNFEPAVDLVFNPAFTPVTADFKAAHFDARRSIYAYHFFINVAEFGQSFISTPEKERVERNIPPKEEDLIFKEIDLFKLRSERKRWEIEQRKSRPFIQSTR